MERILVVDDDALIVQALSKILAAEGYTVVSHTDPLKAADEENIQLVITDFMMPALNGIELLARLRGKNPDAVRLMLTAASDFKVALDAVNRGEVFRLLGKPWNMAELVSVVRQSVEHHRLMEENRRLTRELALKNGELLQANLHLEARVVERTNGLLEGMIAALDYRDTETQWHSRRVSMYAHRLAQKAGVSGDALVTIAQGSMLHDIGKIGVRDAILLKPGPLTPEEWVEMKQHPDIGYRMLANIPYLREASMIVHQHQERWDGKGYPQGLSGTGIVLGARIFSIVDALDAITSDRPYRKGSSMEIARSEITRCIGTQFDPKLVQIFLAAPDSEWAEIRAEVARLEEGEKTKWGGPLMNFAHPPPPSSSSPEFGKTP
jgi:response regulator RpfG family c-di-GMP phosphodiesterase